MRARPRARAPLSAARAGSCADAGPAWPSAPSLRSPGVSQQDPEFASEPDVVNPTVRAASRHYVHSWRPLPAAHAAGSASSQRGPSMPGASSPEWAAIAQATGIVLSRFGCDPDQAEQLLLGAARERDI